MVHFLANLESTKSVALDKPFGMAFRRSFVIKEQILNAFIGNTNYQHQEVLQALLHEKGRLKHRIFKVRNSKRFQCCFFFLLFFFLEKRFDLNLIWHSHGGLWTWNNLVYWIRDLWIEHHDSGLVKVGVFKIVKVSLMDQLSWLEDIDLPSGTYTHSRALLQPACPPSSGWSAPSVLASGRLRTPLPPRLHHKAVYLRILIVPIYWMRYHPNLVSLCLDHFRAFRKKYPI